MKNLPSFVQNLAQLKEYEAHKESKLAIERGILIIMDLVLLPMTLDYLDYRILPVDLTLIEWAAAMYMLDRIQLFFVRTVRYVTRS